MDILEKLRSHGFDKGHISLIWTSAPSDEAGEDYQLYSAELIPTDNRKPNIYILFRLLVSIADKDTYNNPWELIQIISLNQQPFNTTKKAPRLEDFGHELDIDSLYIKFLTRLEEQLVNDKLNNHSKTPKLKTALSDIKLWLLDTKSERYDLQKEGYSINIQNENINNFEIDEDFYDDLDLIKFKELIFTFLNGFQKKQPGTNEVLDKIDFEKLISSFEDKTIALNHFANNEIRFENALIKNFHTQEKDIDFFLPLYICLSNDLDKQENNKFKELLNKKGLDDEIWNKTLKDEKFHNLMPITNNFNLNIQKNNELLDFLEVLFINYQNKFENTKYRDQVKFRQLKAQNLRVMFSFFTTNGFLQNSENKSTKILTSKAKKALQNR